MAITASFVPGTGVLTATGDGLDNAITASRDAAGNILVNGGAVPIAGGTATVANTTLIQAFGQDGNDTIALDETNGALPNAALFGGNGTDTLIGGSGNDVVVGGTGNDVALLGAGNDTFFWNPGDGSDIVEGQAGIDRLDFAGANVNESIDISANGGRVRLSRDVGSVTMDVNDVERIDVHALGGADTVVINDLTGTDLPLAGVAVDLEGALGTGRRRRPGGHGDRQRHGGQRPDQSCFDQWRCGCLDHRQPRSRRHLPLGSHRPTRHQRRRWR